MGRGLINFHQAFQGFDPQWGVDGDGNLLPYVTSDVNNQIEGERRKRVNLLHLEFYSFLFGWFTDHHGSKGKN